jgi:hypothetical protein
VSRLGLRSEILVSRLRLRSEILVSRLRLRSEICLHSGVTWCCLASTELKLKSATGGDALNFQVWPSQRPIKKYVQPFVFCYVNVMLCSVMLCQVLACAGMYACMRVCMNACMYVCMYVCMSACMCPSIDQIGIKMQGGALAIFWPFFLGDIFPQHVFFFVEGPQNDGRVNSRRCVFSFFFGNMCNPCQGPSQGSWSKLGSFFFLAPSEGRLPESGRHGPG